MKWMQRISETLEKVALSIAVIMIAATGGAIITDFFRVRITPFNIYDSRTITIILTLSTVMMFVLKKWSFIILPISFQMYHEVMLTFPKLDIYGEITWLAMCIVLEGFVIMIFTRVVDSNLRTD